MTAPRHQRRDGGEHGQDAWQTHQAMLSWDQPGDLSGRDHVFC
jgi:hypothetical protein